MAYLQKAITKVKALKLNLLAIYLAAKDRRLSWYIRLIAISVVAYAFSPIDLIPDFIPVLGYLDDLILVPLGIFIVLKLIPQELLEEFKQKVKTETIERPKFWFVGVLIIVFWIVLFVLIAKIVKGKGV